jgi:hypothetical protein
MPARHRVLHAVAAIQHHQVKKFIKAATSRLQYPVHVGFPEGKRRVESEVSHGLPIAQAHSGYWSICPREARRHAVRPNDPKFPAANELNEHRR